MSRRRALRVTATVVLGTPLAAVLVLSVVLAWVLLTENGTQWAVGQARPHLPATIRFENVRGVLAGPLQVHGLSVEGESASVEIRRVNLDWDPAALLWSEIRVNALVLEDVQVAVRELSGDDEDHAGPVMPEEIRLPVRLVVEHLGMRNLAVHLPDDSVQKVESVALTASSGPDGLLVENLDVAAPLGHVRGAIRLRSGQPFDLDGTIHWRVRPPDSRLSPLAGTLRLGGSLRRLQVRLTASEPSEATLRLQVRPFADTPRWSGRLTLAESRLDTWWSEAPPLATGADLDLEGTFSEAGVQGHVTLDGLPSGPLKAQLEARGSLAAIRLERLHVEAERRPGAKLDASGNVNLQTEQPRFRLELDWRELAWPMDESALVASPSGSARISGVPDDYELSAAAEVRTSRTGDVPVRVDLEAAGTTQTLSTVKLSALWHETRLSAGGRVRWAPTGEARLQVDVTGLDPGRFSDRLSGQISATADLRAEWDESVRAALDLQSAQGRLNGLPLAATARLRHEAGTTDIDELMVTAGKGRVQASGRMNERLALDWRVNVPDLGTLVPDWGGAITGEGRIEGTPEQPRILVSVTATGLVSDVVDIAALELDGTVAPLGGARTSLQASATEVVTDAIALDSARLDLDGVQEDHRLKAEVRSERGDMDLVLAGGMAGADWSGRIVTARLAPAELSEWVLVDPAGLAWRSRALDLEPSCWQSGEARLCLSASGDTEQWRARLNASRIPVGLVASLARDDLEYSGTFGLDAEFSSREGQVVGRADLALNPGKVVGVLEERPETLLDFEASEMTVALSPDTLEVDVNLQLADEGAVRVSGRIGRNEPRALSGRIGARVENLGLVTVLVPEIGRMEGALVADVELGGQVEDPVVAGTLTLDSGLVEVLPLGIELRDVDADLASDKRALNVAVHAGSGEGRLTVEARIEQGDDGWLGSGRISGADFEAVDLPEVNVIVTPDMNWRLDGRDITVDGKVIIPRARIAPRDLSNTIQASPDAVIVGAAAEEQPEPEKPLRVNADMQVELGPDVRIDAFGLKGRLEGAIRVRERPGAVSEASGELRVVEGTYRIYAQTLTIERGRVLFDGGPVANPGLDVRAVRRPRGVLVGVNVRGRLREPRVTLFSEPPMQESQQLSYLIFGIPLGQTSEGQQASLGAAAAALASSEQGSQIASRIGIQEVSVDHGAPGEGASLVLGRYLSPRLYVGYGIGLMEQANSVRMRYDLTENWNIEARSGETSSADLLYSIEVDSSIEALPELPGLPATSSDAGDADTPQPATERAR